MKALIFNSGLGRRMGELAKNSHKSMVRLLNGETIFERQIRILSECGIKDFIITLGHSKEQLINVTMLEKFSNLNFTFVDNNEYESSNYIYSMYLADKYLNDDTLLLHGDLVFNKKLITEILENEYEDLCLYNEEKELPEKDFKGRIENGYLKEVSVNIFDEHCYVFQPLYKLSKTVVVSWKDEVIEFIKNGNYQVYAENALNNILSELNIKALSYKYNYIDEIDNIDDYNRVINEIRYYDYKEQQIYIDGIFECNMDEILKSNTFKKIFIVGSDNRISEIKKYLEDRQYDFVFFSDFSPNPKYEEVKKGIDLFLSQKCDFIISIGGGSSIDVAKCIKLFSNMDNELDFLDKKYNYSQIKHLAIPTTSGTGSESTRFAVVYYNDEKQSITHDSILPEYVILEAKFLTALPDYLKKSTMLDGLCQAIESYWSKGATNESKRYSETAIKLIMENYVEYLKNYEKALNAMLSASNFSGKAINITMTTAPHAMSYKLTSLYGISHGHAVGLCLPVIWRYMYENINKYQEQKENLITNFAELAQLLNCENIEDGILKLEMFYKDLSLDKPKVLNKNDIQILVKSVNIERLTNHPVLLNKEDLENIYKKVIYS